MTEISREQARQLQQNVLNKRKPLPEDTLFEDINTENKKLNDPAGDSVMINLLRIRFKEGKTIYLHGNIPSSKNSKEIMSMYTGKSECCNAEYDRKTKICSKCLKTTKSAKKPVLHNSKLVQSYIEKNTQQYIDKKSLFLELSKNKNNPLFVGFYIIRDSYRRYDYINCMQIVCDLMVKNKWIVDDSTDYIVPVFLGTHKDTSAAGIIIKILDSDKFNEQLIKLI